MAVNQFAGEAAHVADQFNIPRGVFLALVNQESGFNPTARSSAGAYGLTQLMPGTARGLGVDLSDPHSQLVGGAKYLSEQYQRFGSWKLALAAYNAGPGNVENGAWQHIPETQGYVRNILGLAGRFGGVIPKPPTPAAPVGPTPTPQIAMPILRGHMGLDVNAFANDELNHLGNPGFALKGLATGQYETPQVKQPSFSQHLQTIASPVENQTHAGSGRLRVGKFAYPLAARGRIIGVPYQGTHTMYGNWESDNAVDISAPVGTPIYAVSDGTIGTQFGSLGSSDPRLLGLRLHLQTKGNEFYYAHLSRIVVNPGDVVHKGQLLGYSGSANGVAHLHIASKSGNPLSFFRGHT